MFFELNFILHILNRKEVYPANAPRFLGFATEIISGHSLGPSDVPQTFQVLRGTSFWDCSGYARKDPVKVFKDITGIIDNHAHKTSFGKK